jgi:hypothetical protein
MFRSRKKGSCWLRLSGGTGLVVMLLCPGALSAENDPGGANVKALCSAWNLTQKGLELVDELIVVAKDGIQTTTKLLEECKAKPLCEYSREREMLEKSLADARNQQARAEALSASMQERQNHIRDQLERLPEPAGVQACTNT